MIISDKQISSHHAATFVYCVLEVSPKYIHEYKCFLFHPVLSVIFQDAVAYNTKDPVSLQ